MPCVHMSAKIFLPRRPVTADPAGIPPIPFARQSVFVQTAPVVIDFPAIITSIRNCKKKSLAKFSQDNPQPQENP